MIVTNLPRYRRLDKSCPRFFPHTSESGRSKALVTRCFQRSVEKLVVGVKFWSAINQNRHFANRSMPDSWGNVNRRHR